MPAGRVLSGGEIPPFHDRRLARIAGAVGCHGRPARIADIFHDVDLAGTGPPAIAEQPEGRPGTDIVGHANARFGAAIGEIEMVTRIDPPRNEIGAAIAIRVHSRLPHRFKDQHAAIRASGPIGEFDGFGAVEIGLLFVVDPEIGADDVPFRAVERASVKILLEQDCAPFLHGRRIHRRTRCHATGERPRRQPGQPDPCRHRNFLPCTPSLGDTV